jgi:hypothetical protein
VLVLCSMLPFSSEGLEVVVSVVRERREETRSGAARAFRPGDGQFEEWDMAERSESLPCRMATFRSIMVGEERNAV